MNPLPETEVERDGDARLVVSGRIGLARFPWLADHRADAGPVFPAVCALEFLFRAARMLDPAFPLAGIERAAFKRFLGLPASGEDVDVFAEVRRVDGGAMEAALYTTLAAKAGGIRRRVEHVAARFFPGRTLEARSSRACPEGTASRDGPFEGPAFLVEGARLYGELVPFGAAFRWAREAWLYPEGVTGRIASSGAEHADGLLGDPFVLDSAMHLACAWCERYRGIVGFPVGFASVEIVRPPKPGEACLARLDHAGDEGPAVLFDGSILGADGAAVLRIAGLRMADVSRGAAAPPAWVGVTETPPPDPAAALGIDPRDLVLFEIDAATAWSRVAPSGQDAERTARFHPRRARTFLASRLARERLAAKSPGDGPVSVAHDPRFVVAVRGKPGETIGVDVEAQDGRALAASRAFLSDGERALLARAGDGLTEEEAAVRAWSAKECIGKTRGVGLGKVVSRITVEAIGRAATTLRDEASGEAGRVGHAELERHLLTLFASTRLS